MNSSVFGKTMENVKKHRDIKLVTTYKRRIKLMSEPNYHTKKMVFRWLISYGNETMKLWSYEVDRSLPKEMNKKVIRLMKDELGEKIITESVALRPKAYSCLTDDDENLKKAKGAKKYVTKIIFKFNDYKNYLFKYEIILKS